MRAIPSVPIQFDVFPLVGGLDQHTPQLSLKPGYVRDALNYECSTNGGYARIPGYERFDGRVSPSAATYVALQTTAGANPVVGASVNGQTSGATGIVASRSGTLVVLSKVAGTFVTGENLREGVTVRGVISDAGYIPPSQVDAATYQLAATNLYRSDIAVVPGSGPVRGVFVFQGVVYAFRDNGGGTAGALYKATAGGWSAVTFGHEVSFTAGSGTPPAEGATITQGGVTAVVRRVVVESGSGVGLWGGYATADGRFIIDAPAGGSFAAGALTAGATATLSGANAAIALLPGGRFEVKRGNVGLGVRMYGCDKVNRGFEFDGSVFVPINTGMGAQDKPTHVRVHAGYLFFAFASSAMYSGVGAPYAWTAIAGAAELKVGNPITGFLPLPGDATSAALAILTDSEVWVLYGKSASDWSLVQTTEDGGSKEYSAQNLRSTYMFDDRGVTSLQAVASFGNFQSAALTAGMHAFFQQRRTLLTDTLVNYEKSQYRLFFSDGYAAYLTIVNGKFVGGMPMRFPDAVAVACNGESANGAEVSYFGGTNGYVYRMDVGTSFDGAVIDAFFALAFAAQGNALVRKRYRKAMFELQGDGYAEFNAGYEFAWGDEEIDQGPAPVKTSPVYWDEFTWDAFAWDGRAIAPTELRLDGTAPNIAMRIEQSSALWPSYTINSITLVYTPRRIQR